MTRVNQLRSSPTTNKSLAVVSRALAEPFSKHYTCCRTLTQGAYITLAVEHIHKGRISPLLEFIHERRISLSLSNTHTRGVYHPCCQTHSQGAYITLAVKHIRKSQGPLLFLCVHLTTPRPSGLRFTISVRLLDAYSLIGIFSPINSTSPSPYIGTSLRVAPAFRL